MEGTIKAISLSGVAYHKHLPADITDLATILKGFQGEFDPSAGTEHEPVEPPPSTYSGFWIIKDSGYILIDDVATPFEKGDYLVYTSDTEVYSRIDVQNNDLLTLITSTFSSSQLTGKATQKAVNEAVDAFLAANKTVGENIYSFNVLLDAAAVNGLGTAYQLVAAPASGYSIEVISCSMSLTVSVQLEVGTQTLNLWVNSVGSAQFTWSNGIIESASSVALRGLASSTGYHKSASPLMVQFSGSANPSNGSATIRVSGLYRIVQL